MSTSQPFLFATKAVSASSRALVHDVIPYMDVLTRHVDEFRRDDSLSPMVREAANRGRKILDKYYSRTDETIIFRVAMGMYLAVYLPCCAITTECIISVASGAQDSILPRSRMARGVD